MYRVMKGCWKLAGKGEGVRNGRGLGDILGRDSRLTAILMDPALQLGPLLITGPELLVRRFLHQPPLFIVSTAVLSASVLAVAPVQHAFSLFVKTFSVWSIVIRCNWP